MSKRVIGIDLGTGNSAVATIENGVPTIIVNSEGNRTTPSVIGLKNGDRKVGESARRQRVVSPKETVSLIKRFMGVDYDKCSEIMKHVSYNVVNVNGKPRVDVNGKQYSPEELSSMILAKMKKSAEDFCGEEVTDAVITCPAWFDNNAREATKLAGEMAGLKVHRIINEPTAAILASDIDTENGSKIILVADVGCGTTDFSVCEVSDGMVEVLASKGDVFLGGSDFDNAIASWIVDLLKSDYDVDITSDPQAMQRILEAAEAAKIDLSNGTSTDINLPYITLKDGAPIHLITSLTRANMERLTSKLVDRIVACAKEAVEASKVDRKDISCILMVGGQSRSLAIREALKNEFKVDLNLSVNPDEAVALGAAIQANIIVGGDGSKEILLLDVTPISMGIETMGGIFTKLIDANTTIPCKKTEIFSTAVDNQTTVDIRVLQGERPMAKDNKEVGIFRLDGILPAQRGIPQIEVTFDIDANGILKVSAKDKATNKEQSITIESKGSLTDAEIQRIKNEAEQFAEADKKEKENAEIINKGDGIVFSTERTIKDMNDKLTDEDKTNLNELVSKMKTAVKDKNIDDINSLEKEINSTWNSISERIYSKENQTNTMNGSGNATEEHQESPQDTVDASFEEVK